MLIKRKLIKEKDQKSPKSKHKYKFEGKSGRIKHSFDLDLECLETNFNTREPDFHRGQLDSNDPIFAFTIGRKKPTSGLVSSTFTDSEIYAE